VTDIKENRLVVTKLLQDYDAEVSEAVNGMEAIEQVQKKNPDMILMDLQMPVLNGLDASRMIRNRGYTKTIIAVTANAIKGESQKCYDAGMNDYITKPFRESELMQKVETWLNNGPVSAAPVVAIEKPSLSRPNSGY
jgi:CheY-like chemotaxis protein